MAQLKDVENILEEVDGKYQLKLDVLKKIFTQPDVKGNPVAIYSVFGPSGCGKSYLLNLFCYYLDSRGTLVNMQENQSIMNEVFQTNCDVDSTTVGIMMKTRPYMISNGKKEVAVFLVDTQGIHSFEHQSKEDSLIYALSTLLCSVQIVNVIRRVETNVISELAAFELQKRSFNFNWPQSVKLLIRDWERPKKFPYGASGGKQYLTEYLREQRDEAFQKFTRGSQNLSCFLMPRPGDVVATDKSNNLNDLSDAGKRYFQELYSDLFSSQNISIKQIGGQDVTGEELSEKISQISEFEGNDLTVETMFESIQRRKFKIKSNECTNLYVDKMDRNKEKYSSDEEFKQAHQNAKTVAFNKFNENISETEKTKFATMLDEAIAKKYKRFTAKKLTKSFVQDWKKNIKKIGNFKIDEVKEKFQTDGERYLKEMKEKIEDDVIYREAKIDFLEWLGEAYIEEARRRKFNQNCLIAGISAVVGFAGCSALVLVPPLMAAAVASEIATEVVLVSSGAGLGLAGAAAGGGAVGGLANFFGKKQNVPEFQDPDDSSTSSPEDTEKKISPILKK